MAESYPCQKCGHPVEHTHGAIGRPPWCFCRACGTMFNPEHTNTQPLELPLLQQLENAASAWGVEPWPDGSSPW